jgi:hypothetical protein
VKDRRIAFVVLGVLIILALMQLRTFAADYGETVSNVRNRLAKSWALVVAVLAVLAGPVVWQVGFVTLSSWFNGTARLAGMAVGVDVPPPPADLPRKNLDPSKDCPPGFVCLGLGGKKRG